MPTLPIVLELPDSVMDLNQVMNAPMYSQDLTSSQKPELFDSYIFSTPPTYNMPYPTEDSDHRAAQITIALSPSLDFSRQTWWDSLLSGYTSPGRHSPNISSADREGACQQITEDIRFLFRSTHYWFCFFNVPRFFAVFMNPEKRARMQPSLVLAALAISTFLQSSEVEMGAKGRKKALRLRDEAQGSLEASFNAGWLDESLVQAAWVSGFFFLLTMVLTQSIVDRILRDLCPPKSLKPACHLGRCNLGFARSQYGTDDTRRRRLTDVHLHPRFTPRSAPSASRHSTQVPRR